MIDLASILRDAYVTIDDCTSKQRIPMLKQTVSFPLFLLVGLLAVACNSIAVDPPEEYVTSTPVAIVVASPTLHGDPFPTETSPAVAPATALPESITADQIVPAIDPIRVNFEPGATSATVEGSVSMNGTVPYLLGAAAGQRMTVRLTGENIGVEVLEPNGNVWFPLKAGPTEWSDVLPANGDYEVRIISILGASDKPFTLFVEIMNEPVLTANCFPATLTPQGDFCFYFRGDPDPNVSSYLNVSQIEIAAGLGPAFQIIEVPFETATPFEANSLMVTDMNYDGFDDFAFIEFLPASPNIPFITYIYDPTTEQFVYNDAYRQISSPQFIGENTILSQWRAGALDWGADTYHIIDGTPQLVRRDQWEVLTEGDFAGQWLYTVTEFDPVAGTSTVIQEEIVSPEY